MPQAHLLRVRLLEVVLALGFLYLLMRFDLKLYLANS